MIYKFSPNAKDDYSNIENSIAYRIHNRLVELNGDFTKLSIEEKKDMETIFNELWHSETYRTGKYKIMGYIIDFSEWLNTYWVDIKYFGIHQIKAFNKTCIRKFSTNPSYILKIVELN